MNDEYRELKGRVRRLDEILWNGGGLQNLGFAQALAQVRQLVRRGDRTREPTAAMRASVEHAESLARAL
jgi:hypothetical protein